MVRATYTVNEDLHTLTVIGHANYDEYGRDIVCAGVSAIVQALIGWLEENCYQARYSSVDLNDGEIIVSAEGGEDVSAVFNMASIGLSQIAHSYSDHVHIEFIGTAD